MIFEALSEYILDRCFLYQATATLGAYVTLRFVNLYWKRYKRYQIFKYYGIPGPTPNLYQGNLGDFVGSPFGALVYEKYSKTYGKIYGFFLGDESMLVITDLEMLKQIFFEENASFKERSDIFIESSLTRGILFARYDRWKEMRRMMTPAFNRYNMRGNSSAQFIEETINLMCKYIDEKGKDYELDVQQLMRSAALYLISSIAIGLPDLQIMENEPTVQGLDNFMDSADRGIVLYAVRFPVIRKFCSFLANNFEYDKTLGKVERVLNRMLDNKLEQLVKGDKDRSNNQVEHVLDALVRKHYENKMTREEVIGNAESLLLAGYDTTSTTLTYIFWVLGKYPDVQQKLREELTAHGVDSHYLEKVIHETMRLYPTVISFTTRQATKTVTVRGLVIPQGSRVVHNTWLLHRSAELWTEPLKFDPSRFDSKANIHPCAFAPFGLGDRRCLGYELAMLEMKMVLCDTIIRYNLTLVSPQNLELARHGGVLSRPKERVVIKLARITRS